MKNIKKPESTIPFTRRIIIATANQGLSYHHSTSMPAATSISSLLLPHPSSPPLTRTIKICVSSKSAFTCPVNKRLLCCEPPGATAAHQLLSSSSQETGSSSTSTMPQDQNADSNNKLKPRNVLVTGGCGFIGSNFINFIYEKWPEAK
jgi:hypothetical protein